MEDAVYEIETMRQFAGLKLDRLPDETTILKLRHFLEQHRSIVRTGIALLSKSEHTYRIDESMG